MKRVTYRDVRRPLKNSYFVPEPGAEDRLLEKLGLSHSGDISERRFIIRFKVAVAAVAVIVCLLNIKPAYSSTHRGDTVIAVTRLIDVSFIWDTLLPDFKE